MQLCPLSRKSEEVGPENWWAGHYAARVLSFRIATRLFAASIRFVQCQSETIKHEQKVSWATAETESSLSARSFGTQAKPYSRAGKSSEQFATLDEAAYLPV